MTEHGPPGVATLTVFPTIFNRKSAGQISWLISIATRGPLLVILLFGCKQSNEDTSERMSDDFGIGLIGDGSMNPFPSRLLLDASGHLDLTDEMLPVASNAPLPVDRLRWRTGFSPSQTVVIHLPNLDPSSFPNWRNPEPGIGSVRMFDRTTAQWVPCFAELDSHDEVTAPAILVRPAVALQNGHDIAVVVTMLAAGRPAPFDALMSGQTPETLAALADTTRALLDELERAGLPKQDVALAFDFPIHGTTEVLESALVHARASAFGFDEVRTLDDPATAPPPPLTWRVAKGTMEIPNLLDEQRMLIGAGSGTVEAQGTRQALLHVNIPESVADAPAGTVPVWVFGHGMLHDVDEYLDDDEDGDSIFQLVNDAGVVVVATAWTGLTPDDLGNVAIATADISRFPSIPDQLVQAHLATHALTRLVTEDNLFDAPELRGRSGQMLADPTNVTYFGISLGGVMGPTFLATDPPVQAGVLHVGGGMVMTMLERGYFWDQFEVGLKLAVPDPLDRQRTLAAAQWFIDPVDPMSHVHRLTDIPVLWQETLGDDTVHNLTTRAVARTLGVPVQGPVADLPWGFEQTLETLSPGSSAYTQQDAELGQPDQANTPAERTEAHAVARDLPGAQRQTRIFLHPDSLGTVVSGCGDQVCSPTNPGQPE